MRDGGDRGVQVRGPGQFAGSGRGGCDRGDDRIRTQVRRRAYLPNALRAQDLWTRVFNEVGEEYPEIERDHAYVDAMCMWMIKNPEWFDVAVVCNMFGDIITDLGAMIQGGMGIAAGGNLNPEGVSMFEPIGGSAPKYTGKNVINPLAAICAGQMMLEALGEPAAADAVEKAVMTVTGTKLKSLQAGQMGYSTTEVGDMVAELVG